MKAPGKVFKYIAFAAILLLALAKFGLLPAGTPLDFLAPKASFVRHWTHALRDCRESAAAMEKVRKNKEGGDVISMADGSWVAVVMEHSCCTGAGFNATVYVTSTGDAYLDSDSCYCGFLPLGEELFDYDHGSLPKFLASVQANGKNLIQP